MGGMIKVKFILAMLIALSSVGNALACDDAQNRPGETTDITFSKNSSAVDGKNMMALANWAIDTRSKYFKFESSSIVGFADAREDSPKSLADERASNVAHALDLFGIQSSNTSVIGRVYKPMIPGSKYEPSGNRAEVTLVPGCPNNCCDGQ